MFSSRCGQLFFQASYRSLSDFLLISLPPSSWALSWASLWRLLVPWVLLSCLVGASPATHVPQAKLLVACHPSCLLSVREGVSGVASLLQSFPGASFPCAVSSSFKCDRRSPANQSDTSAWFPHNCLMAVVCHVAPAVPYSLPDPAIFLICNLVGRMGLAFLDALLSGGCPVPGPRLHWHFPLPLSLIPFVSM